MKTLRQMIQELLRFSIPMTTLEIRSEFSEFTTREVDDTLWKLVNEGWALLKQGNSGPLRFTA